MCEQFGNWVLRCQTW